MKTAGKAPRRNPRAPQSMGPKNIPAGRRMQDIKKLSETEMLSGSEYVTDVAALTTFGLTRFRVNPRNESLFPRLSAIASRYEKYKFDRLQFVYRSSAVTTDPGTTYMYADPDVNDATATTKLEVLNHRNCARGKVYTDISLEIDKKDLDRILFCAADDAAGDDRLTDILAFFIGSTTGTAKQVGELEVNYRVTLISPTIDAGDLLSSLMLGSNAGNIEIGGQPLLPIISSAPAFLNSLWNIMGSSPETNYFVPELSAPVTVDSDLPASSIKIDGPAEFDMIVVAEGTGITTTPSLVEAGGQAGQKITITKLDEAITSTTKFMQLWRVVSNNPTSVVSYLHFASAAITTLTKLYALVFPSTFRSSVAPLSRLRNRRKSGHTFRPSLPPPSTAVEPVEPVAKSHGGTCVMLPDLSSPTVPVPAPSPPRFQVVCFRCKCPDLPCDCEVPDHVVLDNEKQKLVCSYNKR